MIVPLTTQDFLYRGALIHPHRVAVMDEPDSPQPAVEPSTFAALAGRVGALAASLDHLAIGVGERVAVLSANSARMLEIMYATTMSGRIVVPVNFRLRPEEIDYVLANSGSRVLLLDPELIDTVTGVGANVECRFTLDSQYEHELINVGTKMLDGRSYEWPELNETSAASINFTSGTTAKPKGVVLSHRNLWINAMAMALHYGVSERDTYLHTLPMFHANGWGMPFVCAGLGVPQIVLRKVDGAEILRRVDRHGVTLMCAAPAVIALVLDAAQDWAGEIPGRGRVRVICGGAPPPTRIVERMEEELGWEFMQIWGMTETAPVLVTNRTLAEDVDQPRSERAAKLVAGAGYPVLGARIRLTDGELLARSNTVLSEYWQRPDETQAALRDGWLHTGDGGAISTTGLVTITDRKKDVIITGGENVSSIEVEDTLYKHPTVADAAVIGVPSDRWGETIKAIVVKAPGNDTITEADLITHCKSLLAGYKAPTSVDFVDQLPRTATGKIQKFQLRKRFWANQSTTIG